MFDNLITYKEAASACHCSDRTIMRAVKDGEIDAWKPGATTLLKKEDVLNWFESKKVRIAPKKGAPRKRGRLHLKTGTRS